MPRTTDTQWRHKSKKSENLGRCGRQNMLWPYPKIWEWEWIFGRAVKAISLQCVRSPWSMPFFLTLNPHCPVLISPKNYTFLTDKTRDAVYGRPPWAHKSIKETQFAGKTICCRTNGVIPITLNQALDLLARQ